MKNTLLVKSIGGRLLSPQHWAHVGDDNYPEQDGTECITRAKTLVMKWDQRKFQKTVQINPNNNCFTFRSTPGIAKYQACEHLINSDQGNEPEEVETCVLVWGQDTKCWFQSI